MVHTQLETAANSFREKLWRNPVQVLNLRVRDVHLLQLGNGDLQHVNAQGLRDGQILGDLVANAVSDIEAWILTWGPREASDSDDSVNEAGGANVGPGPIQQYIHFLKQLPFCDAMIVGFCTNHDPRKRFATCHVCYCPFSELMSSWREIFDLENHGACKTKPYSCEALMGHLQANVNGVHLINSCQWHGMVWHYLNELYPTLNHPVAVVRKRGRDEVGLPGRNDEVT